MNHQHGHHYYDQEFGYYPDSFSDSPNTLYPSHEPAGPGHDDDYDQDTPLELPYTSAHFRPTYTTPPALLPISTSALWPSQISNTSPPSTIAPLPLQPRTLAPSPYSSTSPSIGDPVRSRVKRSPISSNTRKTLSTDDRRRMCVFHDENPDIKQTAIGTMFGVERSTVSKVLRNKDKYLDAEEERQPSPPPKKSKNKFSDIEKTLDNWANIRRSSKLPINDEMIREEGKKFASTVGSVESLAPLEDPVWLAKFKKRNSLTSGSTSRSEKELSAKSVPKTKSKPHRKMSPVFAWDGTPINEARSDLLSKSPIEFFDDADSHTHAPSPNEMTERYMSSDNFLGHESRPHFTPTFPPTSARGQSPIMSAPIDHWSNLDPARLTRRQTVPHLDTYAALRRSQSLDVVDEPYHGMTSEDIEPILFNEEPCTQSSLDTSEHGHYYGESTSMAVPYLSSLSHSDMGPPPPASSISRSISPTFCCCPPSPQIQPSTIDYTAAPTEAEARAALLTLRKYIRHQPTYTIDVHDHVVLGKWMHMLKLDSSVVYGSGSGGIHSMPMVPRADGTLPIGRKRSEHSLS